MKRIPIEMVAEDMILGQTIFMQNGQILLVEGARLKNSYKKRLKQFGIREIYIKDKQDEEKMKTYKEV